MQKMFVRRFLVIMVITVGLTLMGNYFLQTVFAQAKAKDEGGRLVTEITRRIADNDAVIEQLTVSLNDNYLARAWAFAEIIAQNPQTIQSLAEMNRIAQVLGVQEVHVIDGDGILRWGNVPAYYNMNFASTDQTRPFLAGIDDKSFVLAQEPQPNGNEGKLFQYIGVARQDQPGVVQVGVSPEILDDALKNNRMDVIIANFHVSDGIRVTALDRSTGLVEGDTQRERAGMHYSELDISEDCIALHHNSGWVNRDGEQLFAVYGESGNYLIEITFTQKYMYTERQNQNIAATVSSILLGTAIIAAIFVLLKREIINSLAEVNCDLEQITQGDLTIEVDTHATPEFSSLSDSINRMVQSLRLQLSEISAQAATLQQQASELEASNLNILASLSYARKIQNNLLPSVKVFDEVFADYSILWEPRDVVGGDIYWLKSFDQGSVLCVCDCTGHGTPGALLTMLVATALDTIVDENSCADPSGILWELDQKLVSILNVTEESKLGAHIHDGADLAILFIRPNGQISLSAARLHVFVCDGVQVQSIRGQKITIGDGSLKSRDEIKTVTLSPGEGCSCYVVSDGLFDQVGGKDDVPFGYNRFRQLIQQQHHKTQAEVAGAVWREFESYMGEESRRDDVTLIGFKL